MSTSREASHTPHHVETLAKSLSHLFGAVDCSELATVKCKYKNKKATIQLPVYG